MHLVSYHNVFLLIGVHLRNVFELNSVYPNYRMMTQNLPYDISGSKQAHHSKSTNDCPYFVERECMLREDSPSAATTIIIIRRHINFLTR